MYVNYYDRHVKLPEENNTVGIDAIEGLEPISEEDADDIIKVFEDDEYDLVDGYVLCDFSGEV